MAITNRGARAPFLRAVAACGRGDADVVPAQLETVAAVLGDALHRLTTLGGRTGMPLSLASTYACYVTHFLGGMQWEQTFTVMLPRHFCGLYASIALSRDGTSLFIAFPAEHMVIVVSLRDGKELKRICGADTGSFKLPAHVWVAEDGFVFIAVAGNDRIQVMTPELELHSFVGEGQLRHPTAVCADSAIIAAASLAIAYRKVIKVFCRTSGVLLHEFGTALRLGTPHGMCFCDGGSNIAVADSVNQCVWVFSVAGSPVRRFETRMVTHGIAWVRGSDELIVAGPHGKRAAVFDDCGEVVKSFHGNRILACGHSTIVIVLKTQNTYGPHRIRVWRCK